MKGLDWSPLQLPLAQGINQRTDERALQPPALAVALDVQFDEIGGLQTRKPFTALGSATATGGTVSTARRIVANGNELVMFTKDAVYSWNDQLNVWVFRATHLAVSLTEATAFATPGDQVDGDRAELSGIVYVAWTDTSKVYVAATDKATGAVILAPTALGGTATRPRLVALTTRVMLFWNDGTDAAPGNLNVYAIDPTAMNPATLAADLAIPLANIVLAAASCGSYYDAVKVPGVDAAVVVARRAVTTSYTVAKITAGAAVSAVTKARTCDGPIAVSVDPTGATVQVIRANAANIQGDRLTYSTLADAATGQAVGTAAGALVVSQITCAHRSVTNGGAYRCYAFWTGDEDITAAASISKFNYVDTAGTIGTQATFITRLALGSRAFDYDGSVFLWGVFAGQSGFSGAGSTSFRAALQNTYFLYRDDQTLHAKAVATRGGGIAPSIGRLPGVALTSGATGFSWCATERRIISIGSSGEQKGYDARAPRDVTFTFDSNAARRTARLGETLYVTGAEILQYDGVGLYEVGFHVYPWYFAASEAATGNIATNGTYTLKVTWRWENAKGEMERSTTATTGDVVIVAQPAGISIGSSASVALNNTHKTTAKPVSVEVWRTAVNPPEGAPFYLVTSKDPAALTNPNRYIPNDPTAFFLPAFNDEYSDATATTKETNPENGDVLESLAPPGATIIAATETRIFLAGVPGDPDRVWYSRLRTAGLVASFHDTLTFDVPKDGGAITALAFQQGICVVFRETATYMFPGDGFDNTGRGANFGPVQVVSYDVGCRDTDSIANTPEGIVFHSNKGKYLLDRGWTMKPFGLPVSDYDAEPVLATHVVPAQHQIRWLTGSRLLVFDYLVEQWAEWTIASGVHAAIWQGAYHYLLAAGPMAGLAAFGTTGYGFDIETAWIKPADLQGAAAGRKPSILGEVRSACYLRFRVAYGYDTTWIDESYWQVAPSTPGAPMQHIIKTSRQKFESIKFRIGVVGTPTQATSATTGLIPLLKLIGEDPATTWEATFEAVPLGTLGNGITLSIAITVDPTLADFIDVRDHYEYDDATGWVALPNNVGIRVIAASALPSIADVEAQIDADSELLSVLVGNPIFALLDADGFGDVTFTVPATTGGTFAAATGEGVKLTGLGLEVGMAPRLYKRFPRSGGGV